MLGPVTEGIDLLREKVCGQWGAIEVGVWHSWSCPVGQGTPGVEGPRGWRLPDQSAEDGGSKEGRDGQEDISGEKELTTGTKMLMCIMFDKYCHLIEKTREVYLGGAKYT